MKKLIFHNYPRDIEAGNLIETFLIAGITHLLFWRTYLHLTNYPKILFGSFYLPHVLIGGILMTIAFVFSFIYLNRETKYITAIIGGAGFGLFIDELGKYITQDNNYFYEPAVAIIYVVFIILFLIARAAERFFKFSKEEYGINALEISKNVIMHNFDTDLKRQTLNLIKQSDINDPIIKFLQQALESVQATPKGKPHLFYRIKESLKNMYSKIVHHHLFAKIIVISFIIMSLFNFAGAAYNFKNAQGFATLGELIFSFISGLIVFIGAQVWLYKISRIFAYKMFKYSVLVSIFLTQFFRFLNDQFAALSVLILYVVVYSVLQCLIYEERLIGKD